MDTEKEIKRLPNRCRCANCGRFVGCLDEQCENCYGEFLPNERVACEECHSAYLDWINM